MRRHRRRGGYRITDSPIHLTRPSTPSVPRLWAPEYAPSWLCYTFRGHETSVYFMYIYICVYTYIISFFLGNCTPYNIHPVTVPRVVPQWRERSNGAPTFGTFPFAIRRSRIFGVSLSARPDNGSREQHSIFVAFSWFRRYKMTKQAASLHRHDLCVRFSIRLTPSFIIKENRND